MPGLCQPLWAQDKSGYFPPLFLVSQAVRRGWGAWQVDSYALGCASRAGSASSMEHGNGVTEGLAHRSHQLCLWSQMNLG